MLWYFIVYINITIKSFYIKVEALFTKEGKHDNILYYNNTDIYSYSDSAKDMYTQMGYETYR